MGGTGSLGDGNRSFVFDQWSLAGLRREYDTMGAFLNLNELQ